MNALQVIMVIYMAAMLMVGLVVSRYVRNVTDFLLAGRRLGFFLATATLAATHLGGGFILGSGEYGYKYGLGGIWYGAACGLGLIILGLFLAKKLRALALYTAPDYLEMRYGGKTVRVLAALLSLIALVGILAAQVKAAEGVMVTLGFNPVGGAVAATVIFIIYTAMAGLWGVTITDFIQVIIAGLGVLVAALLALSATGGLAAIASAKAGTNFMSVGSIGVGSILWIVIPTVMYTLIGQDFLQRMFASKDESTARNSSLASGILLVILAVFPVLAGMAATLKYPALENARAAIPTMVADVFPPIIGGIVLAAIMAAVMSTADSLLCAGTSHVIKDLYVSTFNPKVDMDQRKVLYWSMISTVVLGILALLIALSVPGIIDALIWAYSMYIAGVFFPLVGGVVWQRATREGAVAGMVVGALVALAATLKLISFGSVPLEIFGALASLVAFVVVSLLTKPAAMPQPKAPAA
ncbi:MAG: sodium:solute symporter family protein [Bacillota bacterium]|nr:sodium:solute symporter family protein [Bacillota bacterium]